jgi:RNA polymerase sigma-70 factor (ECF subfamily)
LKSDPVIFDPLGKSMSRMPDEDLIVRLQSGEGRALEELYRRYSPLLLRYFYRMLWQDKARAQDALHDVFMKIIEKPERVDARRRFSTWVYSVSHNLCKNEYRRESFKNASLNGYRMPHAIQATEGAAIDGQSFRDALDLILGDEGEDARTMLVLRYELEMSFAEIGAVLDAPEGTVKSRLFYLKKRLAGSLETYKTILEK